MRRPRTQGPPRHHGRSLKGRPAPDGIETFFKVKTRDSELPPEEFARLPRRPIHIVLDNLRSAFNVGSIFRLADAARAAEVIPCGYTAYPPHHKLEQTSLGTTDSVPWRRFDDTAAALTDLRAKGIQIVGVETATGASPYHRFEYDFPVALVLGNEALGVSETALRLCDAVVEVPVFGYKNSINVATAASIVLYGALCQGNWLDEDAVTRPDGSAGSGT
ncbi:RNA methyltransferase [candidate division WOR-3 bacterium]|uniref:RNA methyltransferase n=1 Tax=candidate division WOR-3 bacterium TaxID=2052148 RepID=A0A937XEL6_UNCW3|nr:RNA methyltransferase [candidate division WOR-3 bacterium]